MVRIFFLVSLIVTLGLTSGAALADTSGSCPQQTNPHRVRWLKYLAQGVDAIVVTVAMHHGATERVGFGQSRTTPLMPILEMGAEDYIVERAFRHSCLSVQNTADFVLTIPAFINAATTRTTP